MACPVIYLPSLACTMLLCCGLQGSMQLLYLHAPRFWMLQIWPAGCIWPSPMLSCTQLFAAQGWVRMSPCESQVLLLGGLQHAPSHQPISSRPPPQMSRSVRWPFFVKWCTHALICMYKHRQQEQDLRTNDRIVRNPLVRDQHHVTVCTGDVCTCMCV